jgi:hypothetical protein
MSREVDRYGVHWAPGKIAFLHQARGGTNARGLQEASPFEVKMHRRWVCNHLIALNATNPAATHIQRFQDLLTRNALVRFMLPLPKAADTDTKGGVGIVHTSEVEKDLADITMLLKMSSPVRVPILWMSLTTPAAVIAELTRTDVQALVLAGVEVKHTAVVTDLIKAASIQPRRLLVVANKDVPLPGTQLDAENFFSIPFADLVALPWETLGALTLRAYMRDEWAGAWFTREPTPGNEFKAVRRDANQPAGLPSR